MEETIDRARIENIQRALRMSYGVVPLVAGADKFTNLLCDWEKYIAPPVARMLPMKKRTFMRLVGVIEMAAGGLVLSGASRLGGYVVGFWLAGIAGNLLLNRDYDIAVRDLQMALGAWAMAQLTESMAGKKEERVLPEIPPEAREEAREIAEEMHLTPNEQPYVPELTY